MKSMPLKDLRPLTIVACCLAATVSAAAPCAAKTITLTYSSFFPPTHVQSRLSETWCKEVKSRTEGRVKVQYFAGQTLTKARQTYESITDGIADVGTSALAYTRGRFPVMSAIDLPFGYPSGTVATAVANELYAKAQPKEFDDTQVMYFHAHGPGFIHTKEKAVTRLEELKGMKIRSTGTSAEVIKALGGTPVPMPMPESYQSLQKGVVDGSAYPIESNKGWKLGEVVDHATLAYDIAYTTVFFVVMSKERWNEIDPNDQKIIAEINAEWAKKHGEAWDQSDMDGLRFFMGQGNTAHGLSPDENERWKTAVAPLIDDYAKGLDQQKLDGAGTIQMIRDALAGHQQN